MKVDLLFLLILNLSKGVKVFGLKNVDQRGHKATCRADKTSGGK